MKNIFTVLLTILSFIVFSQTNTYKLRNNPKEFEEEIFNSMRITKKNDTIFEKNDKYKRYKINLNSESKEVLKIEYNYKNKPIKKIVKQYNTNTGKLLKMTMENPIGSLLYTEIYSFAPQKRITKKTVLRYFNNEIDTTIYEYNWLNDSSRTCSIIDEDGLSSISYQFLNQNENLVSDSTDFGEDSEFLNDKEIYTYNKEGYLTEQIKYKNILNGDCLVFRESNVVSFNYYKNGLLKRKIIKTQSGYINTYEYKYKYDEFGNWIQYLEYLNGSIYDMRTRIYKY